MRILLPLLALAPVLLLASGCPPAAYSVQYAGSSETERKLLAAADRDVYPNDVRPQPERYRAATLAWTGIVTSAGPDPADPKLAEMVIAHHYWDWIEDHSIQKANAFLSPRGEGEFVCHLERGLPPAADVRGTMAVAYVRHIKMVDGRLHAACIVRLFPREWYATDVFDYGRDGSDLRVLRIPME